MAFLRLLILLLALQTVIFVCLRLYLRAHLRDRLIADWPDHASPRERAAFVEARLDARMPRVTRWLALAVYVLPLAGLALYIYLTNF